MGIISRIRNNTGLLIGAIGLGVAGLVIMDMSSNQELRNSEFNVAKVNGKKISAQEFRNTESILYSGATGDTYAQKDYLYDYFVEKTLIDAEAEELGLNVGKDELIDLQFGGRLSPIISQRFSDPQTGQVDRGQLSTYQQQIANGTMDPMIKSYWAVQEKEIIKDRLQSKLTKLVEKSIYTPNFVAAKIEADQNNNADVRVLAIPYGQISDSDANLTEEDLKTYLDLNKAAYVENEETRNISYITFDVLPSAKDSSELRGKLITLIEEFKNTQSDSMFVTNNYGTYTGAYLTADEMSLDMAAIAFDQPVGTVHGPYIEGRTYNLSKIVDRKIIPDSVKSRHILLVPNTQAEMNSVYARLDSIKMAIENKTTTFAEMAEKFSRDGSATSGGDLGYAGVGEMVQPYNDLIFYKANEGELNIIGTNFGFHLVEVTGRKFINNKVGVNLATISESIIPSTETQEEIRDLALQFIADNPNGKSFAEAAKATGKISMTAKGIKNSDYSVQGLGQGSGTRNLVQWVYEDGTDVGNVGPEAFAIQNQGDFFISKYIVATLDRIREAGEVNVDDVRDIITPLVLNNKKAEAVNKAIQGKSMEAISAQYNVEIDTVSQLNIVTSFNTNLGNETKVVGTVFATPANSVSSAVAGNSGVFVVQPINFVTNPPTGATALIKNTNNMSARNSSSRGVIESLKENAEIEDMRSILY